MTIFTARRIRCNACAVIVEELHSALKAKACRPGYSRDAELLEKLNPAACTDGPQDAEADQRRGAHGHGEGVPQAYCRSTPSPRPGTSRPLRGSAPRQVCELEPRRYGLQMRNNRVTQVFSKDDAIARAKGGFSALDVQSACGRIMEDHDDSLLAALALPLPEIRGGSLPPRAPSPVRWLECD